MYYKTLKTVTLVLILQYSLPIVAGEIGIGVPGASVYYHDTTANGVEYRVGATLGTPTILSGHYRGQLKQIEEHIFWEAGVGIGTAGGSYIPLSIGYRLVLEKQFAIEPMLTLAVTSFGTGTGFGLNIAYRLN